MKTSEPHLELMNPAALVLAIDRAAMQVGKELIRSWRAIDSAASIDPIPHLIDNAGQALRLTQRLGPRALFVCVGATASRLDDEAALIEIVRSRRPGLLLLAVAANHAEDVERAMRIAGANVYLTLESNDAREGRGLLQTLETLNLTGHSEPAHSGLSPPELDVGRKRRRRRPEPAHGLEDLDLREPTRQGERT